MPGSTSEKGQDRKSASFQHFKACSLEPVTGGPIGVAPTKDDDADGLPSDKTLYDTTSFYLDASGRSKMSLPLKFTFPSQEALDHFLANRCIQPIPHNVVKDDNEQSSSPPAGDSKVSLGFEITAIPGSSSGSDGPMGASMRDVSTLHASMKSIQSQHQSSQVQHRAIVEGITVQSSRIEGTSVFFETQVIVRAAHHGSRKVTTRLQIVAVLSEQQREPPSQKSRMSFEGFPDFTLQTTLTSSRVQQTRLEPFVLQVTLTDALAIDVTSVNGPSNGRTLVSLVMRHPNTHSQPVTITNIAMHPGHSRLELPAPPGVPQGAAHTPTHTVCDMSKSVQWGYAPQTQPKLPLTLYPQGAVSTILTVDAMEHMRTRTFKSPVSVTAVVGSPTGAKESINDENKEGCVQDGSSSTTKTANPTTISSADCQWTTGRLAQEPSDAFRIDMQLQNKEFFVGEPFTIFLRVKNMSAEARDMMLLVAKDSDKSQRTAGTSMTTSSSSATAPAVMNGASNNLNNASLHGLMARDALAMSQHSIRNQPPAQQKIAPNTAVVSEVNGYTFGVWGLIADPDNPVFRLDRDQDLLAIDAALLLGEVKGHHSVEAQLRFNPLREGTLDVPNMQLFDKRNRKWYYCNHKLNIVAKQKRDADD